MSRTLCAACGRTVDATARLCPYCGTNPATGEKAASGEMVREVLHRREVPPMERVLEYARQRPSIVVVTGFIVVFLLLAGIHRLVTPRTRSAAPGGPAVPLAEVADTSDPSGDEQPLPMPELKFQYDGRPQAMRSFVVEPGAVTPPEVLAAQQAAAQNAVAQQHTATPGNRPAEPRSPRGPAAVPPGLAAPPAQH